MLVVAGLLRPGVVGMDEGKGGGDRVIGHLLRGEELGQPGVQGVALGHDSASFKRALPRETQE